MVFPTISVVGELAPLIAQHAAETEEKRKLAAPVVDALIKAGIFRLMLPTAMGGAEATPLEFREVVEAVSAVDGSTGWCVMISGGYGQFAGLLPDSAATEVYKDPATVVAGTFRPNGTARIVEGGFSVTGQWPMASGSSHATWLVGGCRIIENGKPRLSPNGKPEMRMVFVPVHAATIIDTWRTIGLRGTASNDFALHDCFVPDHRTFWFSHAPVRSESLYRLPALGISATWIASVSIGIARHAINIFSELARTKTPTGAQNPLREKETVQLAVGQAEGLVRGGRAFVAEVLEDVWSTATTGGAISPQQRALLWLASTQAATQAVQAVELLFSASGASSVYADTGLERCLRDIRTAAQHVTVTHTNFELAGRVNLGLSVQGSVWSIDDRGIG